VLTAGVSVTASLELPGLAVSFIRPLKIGLPSSRPILLHRYRVRCWDRGLVSKSASWSCVCTWRTWRHPWLTRSRTKWRSIWICFMRVCLTGLKVSCVAPRLSHSNIGGCGRDRPSSVNRICNHWVSEAAFAKARYSASAEERAIARCLLDFQEIGVSPRKHIYAEVEDLSSRFPAQSASKKVLRAVAPVFEIWIPWKMVFFR